jgi:Family of unknown function (DUF5522)
MSALAEESKDLRLPLLSKASRALRDNSFMASDSSTPPALAPEDFYYEGPYLVFTAAYHLKRGSCCNSGCRHCPYQEKENESASQSPPPEAPLED